MDKREGGGSHNWGTFEDEMKAEEDKNNVSVEENGEKTEKSEGGENRRERRPKRNDDDKEEDEEREEEMKTFTLDEWKAQQKKKEDNAKKFNVRKAGEGSDIDPKWKKTYAYKKERETHEDEEEEVRLLIYSLRPFQTNVMTTDRDK